MKNFISNLPSILLTIAMLLLLYPLIKLTFYPDKTRTIINTTTDTTIVSDTIFVDKPFNVLLPGKIDTIWVDNKPQLVASADTVLYKDSSSISIKYYFPPKNIFDVVVDIKEKIVKELKTVTITKEVEKPFYQNIYFYTTLIFAIITGFLL